MRYIIYFLEDPRNKNKGYIGKTCDLKRRLSGHFNPTTLKDKTKKNHWIKKLKRLGLKPIVKILKEVSNNKEANKCEVFLIKKFKKLGYNLVNGTPGGDGWAKGFKMPKTKKRLNGAKSRMRAVILRDKKTGKDRKFKSVISAAKFTEIDPTHASLALNDKERCISAGGYYWRYSDQEFIPPRKGKKFRTVKGTNLKTKETKTYYPAYECEKDGFNSSCVSAICKGKRKQHKGWTFRYV